MNFIKFMSVMMIGISSLTLNAQQTKIKIAAHRGFWKNHAAKNAENSVKSLELAQANAFWGSEFDVHLTKDNVVVVFHDDDIDGKPIHSCNYDEIKNHTLSNGEKLPTLEDYLEQGTKSSKTMLVLEIKEQESNLRTIVLTKKCMEILKEKKLYDPSRVMFISFNLAACKYVAKYAPQFTNQYLNGDIAPKHLKQLGINGLDYEFDVLDKNPNWIKQAHKYGMSVNVWTVNTKENLQRMIDLGVDCITTNEPLLLRSMLQEREFKQ